MSGTAVRETRARAGFSFVELVMALLVLAFGVVGLATTTLLVSRQLTLAEVTGIRATALQSTIERIRATPYDSISVGGDTIGPMTVSWTATTTPRQTKIVRIVTVGPGLASISEGQSSPIMSSAVADTVLYVLLRP